MLYKLSSTSTSFIYYKKIINTKQYHPRWFLFSNKSPLQMVIKTPEKDEYFFFIRKDKVIFKDREETAFECLCLLYKTEIIYISAEIVEKC